MENRCLHGCRWWCLWWRLFVLSFFPRDVLDEIWDLIESASEGFPSYSSFFWRRIFNTAVVLHISWLVMNRLNKTEFAVFISLVLCCTFHDWSWTESIKPSLLFSFLWCSPCIQGIQLIRTYCTSQVYFSQKLAPPTDIINQRLQSQPTLPSAKTFILEFI